MGQVLHANARTTEAIRREIRDSKESIAKTAARFNVTPKTIVKWRKREDTKDLPPWFIGDLKRLNPQSCLKQKKKPSVPLER